MFALQHEPALAARYAALVGLLAAQAEAITEGMARAAQTPSPVPASAASDAVAEAWARHDLT
jgi:serine/threonine protein kinase HipA of HipAB toxin-antitoxin module